MPRLEIEMFSAKASQTGGLVIQVSMSTLKHPAGRLCSLPTQSHKNGYGEKCGINGV